VKWLLKIPPHLKRVATVPCEIVLFKKLLKFGQMLTDLLNFSKQTQQ